MVTSITHKPRVLWEKQNVEAAGWKARAVTAVYVPMVAALVDPQTSETLERKTIRARDWSYLGSSASLSTLPSMPSVHG